MKISIFGSTGPTGRELVNQALEKGYKVSTLVRNPLDIVHANLTVIKGNIFDIEAVKNVIENSDAVISVLGFTPQLFREKSTDIYSKIASLLVKAMTELNLKKLMFCTSAGVENDPNEIWFYKHILKPLLLQKVYDDMQLAEKIITESSLDWILVRPARMTNGSLTTQFRVSERFRSPGGTAISRADTAFFMLNQVTDNQWVHRTPTLTY
ncbi:unnamed protein product [Didymodactylos carnosus]|uniref:NAD(P)-binding domain-containing protein n=1 Tax=Didymodactylos carnosus TaxID=1234261 RepID=A0A8S2GRK3_9BILA|nr:unnamed protein product [Didymodactylos carnosus]CAF3551415.1 unnamed protein product [Didymodactylos carnosus]